MAMWLQSVVTFKLSYALETWDFHQITWKREELIWFHNSWTLCHWIILYYFQRVEKELEKGGGCSYVWFQFVHRVKKVYTP